MVTYGNPFYGQGAKSIWVSIVVMVAKLARLRAIVSGFRSLSYPANAVPIRFLGQGANYS